MTLDFSGGNFKVVGSDYKIIFLNKAFLMKILNCFLINGYDIIEKIGSCQYAKMYLVRKKISKKTMIIITVKHDLTFFLILGTSPKARKNLRV